ncbi:MAG TPA: hypothetical protein PLA68_08685, partial [Panacibacter sp.]|nr:hypothetical protein [Panacibacter sp.]
IKGLRAAAGTGIEFLQYLEPGPGKPFPADTRSDDIWHWQTTLIVDDAAKLYNKLKMINCVFVSKGIVELKNGSGKNSKAFIVRDPDGHAMLVKEI